MPTVIRKNDALAELFASGTKITFAKGDFIIEPGQVPTGLYLITDGFVKAFHTTKYGEENLLLVRKKGEMFGLTWAMGDGFKKEVSYTALSPTTLMYVPTEKFSEFLVSHPGASMYLNKMLLGMYHIHTERIMTLAYRSVRERLIAFLINNSRRFGEVTPHGILLDVPLRHQDIAGSISATRETTSRELALLERQGLIKRGKRSIITILDPEKMKTYL